MKRFTIIAIVTMLIALFAIAGLLPLTVKTERVRARIERQAQILTGQSLVFTGNPVVRFNPFLQVELHDVQFIDPLQPKGSPPLMLVEQLQGRLEVIPALFGSIRFGELHLIRPEINLTRKMDGSFNWNFKKGSIANAVAVEQAKENKPETAANNKTRPVDPVQAIAEIGHFDIKGAIVNYQDMTTNASWKITNLQADVYWKNTGSALEASGSGVWDGVPLNASAKIQNPLALLTGGESEVEASAASETVNLSFAGNVNTISNLFVDGISTLEIPSLTRFGQLVQHNLSSPLFPNVVKLSGKAKGTITELTIEDGKLDLDGNFAKGLFQIKRDDQQKLNFTGTIAFGDVNLSHYLANLASKPELAISPQTNVDMRLSAANVMFGDQSMGNVAAAVSMRGGKLNVDVGDATYLDGHLIGNLQMVPAASGVKITAAGSLKEFSTDKLFETGKDGSFSVAGTASINTSLEFILSGDRSWIRSLYGSSELKMQQGTLNGLDLADITQGFLKLNETTASAPTSPEAENSFLEVAGKTDFSKLAAQFNISHGVADFRNFVMEANEQQLTITGRADLAQGGTALQAKLVGLPGNNNPEIIHRFLIGGTFRNPVMTVQPNWSSRPPTIAPTDPKQPPAQ